MPTESEPWILQRAIAALFAAAGLASSTPNAQAAAAPNDSVHGIHIMTLSARPYLVSGGDVLVRIDLPQKMKVSDARVTQDSPHGLTGLVTDLQLGKNLLIALSANSQVGRTG